MVIVPVQKETSIFLLLRSFHVNDHAECPQLFHVNDHAEFPQLFHVNDHAECPQLFHVNDRAECPQLFQCHPCSKNIITCF